MTAVLEVKEVKKRKFQLNMLNAETIKEVVELFVVPLGVFVLAWIIHPRVHSTTELFIYLSSLDFVYLLNPDTSIHRINTRLAPMYTSVFVTSALISIIFLVIAAKTQRLIDEHLIHKHLFNRHPS